MKICLNTATTGKYPLADDIRFCGKYGYDGIEIDTGKLEAYLKSKSLTDLKKLLADNRLKVAALMAFGFVPFGADKPAALAVINRWAPAARDLGAQILLTYIAGVPPADMPLEQAFTLAGKSGIEYAELAQKYGLKIALEPIGGHPFMPGPVEAMKIIAASGNHPALGLMMDTFHYYKSGISREAKQQIPSDRLLIVHVNDCEDLPREQLNDSHRLYCGLGVIPLVEDFRMLAAKSYQGYLSIEIFRPEYWQDKHENIIRRAKSGIDKVLAKI